jgi:hypothetical protein
MMAHEIATSNDGSATWTGDVFVERPDGDVNISQAKRHGFIVKDTARHHVGVIDEDHLVCRPGHVNSSGHVSGWQVVHGGRERRDGQHMPDTVVHGALQCCQPLHLLEGGAHHFGGLLHRRVRTSLRHE